MTPPASETAIQFRYPLPLAAVYRAVRTAGDAAEQVGAVFAATELLLRFLTIVNLSTLLADSSTRSVLTEQVTRLRRPVALGTWLSVLRDSTRATSTARTAFFRELPAIFEETLESTCSRLIEGRNDVIHARVKLTAAEATVEAQRLVPLLREAFQALGCLVDYRLGIPAGVRPMPEGGFRIRWTPLTGLEEPGEPLMLSTATTALEGLPTLIAPTGEALCLWPFARWALAPTDGAEHLFLLAGPQGFTHHRQRYVVARIAEPSEPTADLDCDLADACERGARIALRVGLGLGDASLRRLADRGQQDGQRIADRYLVRGVLGRGGMGTVYRVYDEQLEVDRALKVLHPDLLRSTSEVERFHREGQLLAKLDDPRFVRVHTIDEDAEGRPFIVMDEVEGRTLQDLIDERGSLPLDEAVELVASTLDALAVAHAKGIVHRDLKPANILRRADGTVCILDLGVAFQTARLTRVTAPTSAVGTLGYMAPEQAEGRPELASDQWAAAATFNALLGDPNLAGGHVQRLIKCAQEADPARRFGHVTAMASSLRAAHREDTELESLCQQRLESKLRVYIQGAPWPLAWSLTRASRQVDDRKRLCGVIDSMWQYILTLMALRARHEASSPLRNRLMQMLRDSTPLARLESIESIAIGSSLEMLAPPLLAAERRRPSFDEFVEVRELLGDLSRTNVPDSTTMPDYARAAGKVAALALCMDSDLWGSGMSSAPPFLRVKEGVPYLVSRIQGRRLMFSAACGPDSDRSDPLRTALDATARPSIQLCGSSRAGPLVHTVPKLAFALGQAIGSHGRLEAIASDGGGPVERFAEGYRSTSGQRGRTVMQHGDSDARGTQTDELEEADVVVFVGGGSGTEGAHAFAVERCIPSILVTGTGGVTDELARHPTLIDRVIHRHPTDDRATAALVLETIQRLLIE